MDIFKGLAFLILQVAMAKDMVDIPSFSARAMVRIYISGFTCCTGCDNMIIKLLTNTLTLAYEVITFLQAMAVMVVMEVMVDMVDMEDTEDSVDTAMVCDLSISFTI